MSTKAYYPISEIGKDKPGFSKTRSIIEAAFYGNNVVKVNTLKEAYELAKNSPGTVVTDMPVYRGEEFGLETDAKVLLFNRIAGEPGVDCEALDKIAMDAVYNSRWKTMYHAEVFVGLDPEFMVKAHLMLPEGEENILYNWMLNFQYMSDEYVKMYRDSKPVGEGKEPDIFIFSDPQWTPVEYPGVSFEALSDPAKKTLCYFNTNTNCACILGMRYFGEHKKGMGYCKPQRLCFLPRRTERVYPAGWQQVCSIRVWSFRIRKVYADPCKTWRKVWRYRSS